MLTLYEDPSDKKLVGVWRDEAIARLTKLTQLEEGWDGYGGLPVSFENACFALRVLDAICPVDAPTPQMVPGVNGDLQIEWHEKNTDIELHVITLNNVRAWRMIPPTQPIGEEISLTNDFTVLADWVKQITEPVPNE
jgi:hypothetical protein